MASYGYSPLNSVEYGMENSRNHTSTSGANLDIVQFLESVVVVESASGQCVIQIMRIGACTSACSFTWKTVQGSAQPGKQYIHTEGTITMKPDEGESSITVPIVSEPFWNATKEFRIVLENPDGCVLGLYLKEIRVKVLDADTFPSSAFREQIEKELENGELTFEGVDMFRLFYHFLKLMRHQEGIMWRTALTLFVGLLHNIYDYVSLIMSVYMVDTVFNLNEDSGLIVPGQRLATAYLVASILFIPEVVFFVLHQGEVYMDISGILQKSLSKSLFRKFMNYSTGSKGKVPLSEMVASVVEDVGEVSFGYKRTLDMIRLLGQILIGVYFTLAENPGVWWAVFVVPALMAVWGKCRINTTIEYTESADVMRAKLASFVSEMLSKMPFIAAYKQRPQINELFEEKADDLKDAMRPKRLVHLNNMVIPKLTGPALVALYTIIGAGRVLDKSLGLGTYLATIRVFASICRDFANLYENAMSIVGTFPALKGLAVQLNLPTDLKDVMQVSGERAKTTAELRGAMDASDVPRADRLGIFLKGLQFAYPRCEPLFYDLRFETKQGKIIGILAASGCGRKTLLELMSGNIYPTKGELFIPSHLRCLFVSSELHWLSISLWANLTFGNKAGNDPYRVERILKHFRLNRVLADKNFQRDLAKRKREHGGEDMEAEDEEEQIEHEASPIAHYREGEKALVHLARAFIMNPEVLLIHRPFVHFHDPMVMESVRVAFVQHRDQRGLESPMETLSRRRPRTIFVTPDFARSQKHWVDEMWHLPDDVTRAYSGKDGQCLQYKPGSDVDHALAKIEGRKKEKVDDALPAGNMSQNWPDQHGSTLASPISSQGANLMDVFEQASQRNCQPQYYVAQSVPQAVQNPQWPIITRTGEVKWDI